MLQRASGGEQFGSTEPMKTRYRFTRTRPCEPNAQRPGVATCFFWPGSRSSERHCSSQSATLVNIGIPDSATVVDVQVQWPDGTSKKYDAVDVGKTVEIQQ